MTPLSDEQLDALEERWAKREWLGGSWYPFDPTTVATLLAMARNSLESFRALREYHALAVRVCAAVGEPVFVDAVSRVEEVARRANRLEEELRQQKERADYLEARLDDYEDAELEEKQRAALATKDETHA